MISPSVVIGFEKPELEQPVVVAPPLASTQRVFPAPVTVPAVRRAVSVPMREVANTALPLPISSESTPRSWAEVVEANWLRGLPVTPQVAQAMAPAAEIVIGEVPLSPAVPTFPIGIAVGSMAVVMEQAPGVAGAPVQLPKTELAAKLVIKLPVSVPIEVTGELVIVNNDAGRDKPTLEAPLPPLPAIQEVQDWLAAVAQVRFCPAVTLK
jgi:hypothetical protein